VDKIIKYEIWKEVPGFPGYEISSHGRARSWRQKGPNNHRRPKPLILKPCPDSDGYLYITLHNNGKQTQGMIHLLILTTFKGPRPEGMVARHLNGNNTNNFKSNLKWGTPSENILDSYRHGTVKPGSGRPWAKLDEDKVTTILSLISLEIYTNQQIANWYKISKSTINQIKQNIIWKHVEPETRDKIRLIKNMRI